MPDDTIEHTPHTVPIRDSNGLLELMLREAKKGNKMWFDHITQRVATIELVFRMAPHVAQHMKPSELVDYAKATIELLYQKAVLPAELQNRKR